jgi:ADP-ribose pyrophosphatase
MSTPPFSPWKTLSRDTVLAHSKYLTVEDHTVELSDGRIIERWPWIITPDFINVVVETTEHQFICFRQTKYAVEGVTLAPVGGYLEPGEDPLTAAQRELLEETGYAASEWIDVGRYCLDANRGACTAYLFLARGAYYVQPPDADDLEEQELVFLTRTEIETALTDGEFKVLSWAANVAFALRHIATYSTTDREGSI